MESCAAWLYARSRFQRPPYGTLEKMFRTVLILIITSDRSLQEVPLDLVRTWRSVFRTFDQILLKSARTVFSERDTLGKQILCRLCHHELASFVRWGYFLRKSGKYRPVTTPFFFHQFLAIVCRATTFDFRFCTTKIWYTSIGPVIAVHIKVSVRIPDHSRFSPRYAHQRLVYVNRKQECSPGVYMPIYGGRYERITMRSVDIWVLFGKVYL